MSRRTRGVIPGVINHILDPTLSGSGGGGGEGEENTGANLGDGTAIFKQKEDTELQFKTLKAGDGIIINDDDTVIEITGSMTLTSPSGHTYTLGVTDGGIITVT